PVLRVRFAGLCSGLASTDSMVCCPLTALRSISGVRRNCCAIYLVFDYSTIPPRIVQLLIGDCSVYFENVESSRPVWQRETVSAYHAKSPRMFFFRLKASALLSLTIRHACCSLFSHPEHASC